MAAPAYNLVIQRKPPEGHPPGEKNPNPFVQVGVGFVNDGPGKTWISVKLNDGLVLDWRMEETHRIRLYPNDKVPF